VHEITEAKSVVLLSGGQDSTTCLYWALQEFGSTVALTFDYQQRHRVELECAQQVARLAGVPQKTLPINTFSALGNNALNETLPIGVNQETGLPNTFVPGRNFIFLTFAAAYAYPRGIRNLVIGVSQIDYSGYPDCREGSLKTLQQALCLGLDYEISIHTPLMHLSKKEVIELAIQLGAFPALALTHTCYLGQQPPCGKCPACRIRAQGFAAAGVSDPLLFSV